MASPSCHGMLFQRYLRYHRSMGKISLSVIIVSFNTLELTKAAIESVFATTKNCEVIVVDNNSMDDTVAGIQKTFGKKVHLIENKENLGFARANNQGMKQAQGDFLLLLNSDTVVQPAALDRMTKVLQAHPEYGAVSCALTNTNGSYQFQGGALPTLATVTGWWLWPLKGKAPFVAAYQDASKPNPQVDVEERGWIAGTALMFSRTVYEKIGGLDEAIFMYAEDVEFCLRVRNAGYKVGIVPSATIMHYGSASSTSERAKLGEIQGLLYIFSVYYPGFSWNVLRLVLTTGAVLRYLFFGILKASQGDRRLYHSIIKTCIR